MVLRSIVLSLALFPVAASAQVQLIGTPPSNAVFEIGRPAPPPPSPPAPLMNLAQDFDQFGGEAPAMVVPTVAAELVPHWMRGAAPRPVTYFQPAVLSATIPAGGQGACQLSPVPNFPIRQDALQRRAAVMHIIAEEACAAGIPAKLFDALVHQESRYKPFAVSRSGAMGLAQLMPGTARDLGVVNAFDLRANLRAGARYLREQFDTFGRYDLALAAYNAGPGRVRRSNGVPPIAETIDYVRTITASWAAAARSEAVLVASRF